MLIDQPSVFLDRHRHSFLRVRSGPKFHLMLTLESGEIDVIKVPLDSEKMRSLIPYDYDYKKALRIYTESTLTRSAAAARELALILDGGKELPTRKIVAPEFRPDGTIYTLEELAKEFDLAGNVARKILRKRLEKPGNRWMWDSAEAADEARQILAQHCK
jgi:hypothetical protein